jgi:hypothetical protein
MAFERHEDQFDERTQMNAGLVQHDGPWAANQVKTVGRAGTICENFSRCSLMQLAEMLSPAAAATALSSQTRLANALSFGLFHSLSL